MSITTKDDLAALLEALNLDKAGAPHGITATHPDQINAELLAFIRSNR